MKHHSKKWQKKSSKRVIDGSEVMLMKDVTIFMNSLLNSLDVDSSYPSSKLKLRLQQKFGQQICFWHPKWRGESELLYSNEIPSGKFLYKSIQSQKILEEPMEEDEHENIETSRSSSGNDEDALRFAFTTGV